MTFKEYFNLSKETVNSCLKICGGVFSAIFILIAILLANVTESFTDAAKIFGVVFLSVNAFVLLICALAITSAYGEAKRVSKFYNSIPNSIKKRFKLELAIKPLNPKFNYLKFEFLNSNSEEFFLFNYSKELVWITLLVDLGDAENLSALIVDINSTYKKENIELTAWGLRKKIKWKEWNTINDEKINTILEELTAICHKQHLTVTTKELKDSEISMLVGA